MTDISNPYEGCRICKGKGYVESVEHVTPCMACYNRIHGKDLGFVDKDYVA